MMTAAITPTLMEAVTAAHTRSLKQWNILRELRLAGRVDVGRLAWAIEEASAVHPFARARRVFSDGGAWHWRLGAASDEETVRLIHTGFPDTGAVLREVQAHRLSAMASAALRCIVVRSGGADRLLFNFCHERTDGIGAMAYLSSVQQAYAGELDSAREVDWIARRGSPGDPVHHPGAWPGLLQAEPIEHLECETGRQAASFDTHVIRTKIALSDLRRAAVPVGVTITHRIVAALTMACERWNSQRGRLSRRICIAVPVNARPAAWARGGVFSRFGTMFLNTLPEERTSVEAAALSLASQARCMTPIAKAAATSLARPAPAMLIEGEQPHRIPDALVPTASVSSLGAWHLGAMGQAGAVLDLWAPPLAQEPMAVALGVLGLSDGVSLSFRFAASMIGPDGGRALVRDVLRTLVS